ncbi:hypothetical protein [Sphingomonas prati]|uniref:Uncharacterized protein n=1 Tax=Sphingomonas prati TaxID=1843237 RepID=A0A7W9F2L4_9SPHN|nr:hypothetical protein [Sphingomonas prati]MBB5730441.1 hypothetical protein [Sphingomonas prati]GGE94087.1 hypothetical protein GCM10011404_28930 [Sphingomonas prati]
MHQHHHAVLARPESGKDQVRLDTAGREIDIVCVEDGERVGRFLVAVQAAHRADRVARKPNGSKSTSLTGYPALSVVSLAVVMVYQTRCLASSRRRATRNGLAVCDTLYPRRTG